MKQEKITAEIGHTDALSQLSFDAIMDHLDSTYGAQAILEFYDSDILITHLGGMDKILEDHPNEVQDHIANTNASNEQDRLGSREDDGLCD